MNPCKSMNHALQPIIINNHMLKNICLMKFIRHIIALKIGICKIKFKINKTS